jgi:LPXTG-site transpeptidase (sortase) family protein
VIQRAFGSTPLSRLGTVLMLMGMLVVLYSLAAYMGVLPGGYTTVPEPVAFSDSGQRAARLETGPAEAPAQAVVSQPLQESTDAAVAQAAAPTSAVREPVIPPRSASTMDLAPTINLKLDPADAADRRAAATAGRAGNPVRLQLPSINVDTEVKGAGLAPGKDGEPEWETLPFVAAHYPMLGPVGAPGNAVISGHVVTLSMGNVFRDLYKVKLGEPIEVFTEDSHFSYRVEEIKLVKPEAVEVMAPTEDARLTVITCGGTFDPRTRTFSDRLVLVGKLVGGERL